MYHPSRNSIRPPAKPTFSKPTHATMPREWVFRQYNPVPELTATSRVL